MYDTVACTIEIAPSVKLTSASWQGKAVTEDLETGGQVIRRWLNPRGDGYAPRLTYWDGGILKVEFSVPKMVNATNPTERDKEHALDLVNAYLRSELGVILPDVRDWRCSRVDYAWTFDTSPRPAREYLHMLEGLQLRSARRHSFKGDGVVWKSRGRWVKFYDKRRLDDHAGDHALRFEVSNYRSAVDYMQKKWFACDDKTVREMLQPGRALYVLAVMWSRLGLDVSEYSHDGSLLVALRECFGGSAAPAWWILTLYRTYGRDAVYLDLVSASSWSEWTRRLRDNGFLAVSDEQTNIVTHGLPALRLPANVVFEAQNLGRKTPRPILNHGDEKIWEFLRANLGLARAKPQKIIMDAWREYTMA